ncbi:MAG: HAD hydrolase-like protein [Treponema sp.]|nr:HAD hydrolase-like protein [Treponema sp.]
MNKIKAVLFDYDGVMTLDKSGSDSVCNFISAKMGIDKTFFKNEYRKFNNDLSDGKITHIDIWEKLCENTGKQIPLSVLYDSFINTPIDVKMHDFVLKIKNQNIITGLITDNKADRIDYIDKKHDLGKYYDIIAVSGKLGYGKYCDKIFLYVLEKLNVKPEECIFIDNQENNLIIPDKLGFNTLYYDDETRDLCKLKNEIENLGISL